MVKFSKSGVIHEFTSWNHAVRENGYAGTGLNAAACKRWMQKSGFEFISDDGKTARGKNTNSSKRNNKERLFNQLLEFAGKPDEEALNQLRHKKMELMCNLEATLEDLEAVIKINEEISRLKNPTVNEESFLACAKALWGQFKQTEETEESTETTEEAN